jgi:hypothetical protein
MILPRFAVTKQQWHRKQNISASSIVVQRCCGQLVVDTHRDVINVAHNLIAGHSRAGVKSKSADKIADLPFNQSDDTLTKLGDLVARHLVILDLGELRNAFSGQTSLSWTISYLKNSIQDVSSV